MNKNELALNALKKIVGDELFKTICNKMAGARIYIKPYTPFQSIVERNNNIKIDFLSGVDVPVLALKYDLSESRIQDIIYDRGAAE